MNIDIKATNLELTDAIRSYVYDKFSALDKLIDASDTSASAQVEVGKTTEHHQSGDIFRTEINLHVAGANFRAVEKTGDLYASVDIVKDKIVRELRRHKEKQSSSQRKGARVFKKFMTRFRFNKKQNGE
jgi:putative sigma-54 modulation protein